MLDMSLTMLNNIQTRIPEYGGGYSNWAMLMLHEVFPYYELAVMSKDPAKEIRAFSSTFIPNKLFMGAKNDKSSIPLLEFKYVEGETMIYVCVEKTCQIPVSTLTEALKQID
jgi:uncharacterized protein